jgi:hypothetical protein
VKKLRNTKCLFSYPLGFPIGRLPKSILHAQSDAHTLSLILIILICGHKTSAIALVFQHHWYNEDVSTPSYSQCPDFKPRLGHRLPWLSGSAMFLPPCRQFHYTSFPFHHPQSAHHLIICNLKHLKHHRESKNQSIVCILNVTFQEVYPTKTPFEFLVSPIQAKGPDQNHHSVVCLRTDR